MESDQQFFNPGQNQDMGQQTQNIGQCHNMGQQSQNVGQFKNMGQQSQKVGQAQNVGQNQNVGQQGQRPEGGYFNRGPMCLNCRQYGHYQWNCPVSRRNHSRKHLN